jgi:hypothetical protein
MCLDCVAILPEASRLVQFSWPVVASKVMFLLAYISKRKVA